VKATDPLGGNTYTTISFMHQALQIIKQDIYPLTKESVNIDLTTLDTVFDEDVEYVDSPEDEIGTRYPKGRKIYIETQNCKDLEKNVKNALCKTLNHYWNIPNNYAMIGALLDPRCKELRFSSEKIIVIRKMMITIIKVMIRHMTTHF
jgi:hypothetical protein